MGGGHPTSKTPNRGTKPRSFPAIPFCWDEPIRSDSSLSRRISSCRDIGTDILSSCSWIIFERTGGVRDLLCAGHFFSWRVYIAGACPTLMYSCGSGGGYMGDV